MPLQITNSLTKQKEEFKPLKQGVVAMYVCGPTVYDEPHIGHLRSAYVFDVIRRYLEFSGYRVRFIRNVTDVDDKIIEKARQNGASDLVNEVKSVSEKYYALYLRDLKTLGVSPPKKEPRATEHIPEMIRLIEKLIEKDFAYVVDGDVYFEIARTVDYGKLSHQKKEAMIEGVRVDPNEKKKNPLDFALWKKAKIGEPAWRSPWGEGRPGWHIECSAMSMKYLGETLDIHGGGRDLIFPHHENEIAQSEGATGKDFAHTWIHHGLVTKDGQKMSKSQRNFVTLSEIISHGPWALEELKFLFLGTHYGAPLDYSEERMKMEKAVRERFWFFFEELKEGRKTRPKEPDKLSAYRAAFRKAMDDDFNTPAALSVMHEVVHEARKTADIATRLGYARELKEWGKLFGLFGDTKLTKPSNTKESVEKRAQSAIHQRAQAKKNRDFEKADAIRKELLGQGIALTDHSDGTTTWRWV